MHTPLWPAVLIVMTCLLASCGGGGDNSPKPMTEASCDSGTLWAAHPSPNGFGIPDNNSMGISVTWDNQACALQTVSSASLDICLTHTAPADLVWKITPPSTSNPLTLNAPANWNSTGTSCDLVNGGSGRLQRLDLLQSLPSGGATRGLWTLNVSDGRAGDTGTLVQWRLLIQGLR